MSTLNHIWPWSKIRRLEAQIEEERVYSNEITAALLEIDPAYFEKLKLRLYCKSPRMGYILTGIEKP